MLFFFPVNSQIEKGYFYFVSIFQSFELVCVSSVNVFVDTVLYLSSKLFNLSFQQIWNSCRCSIWKRLRSVKLQLFLVCDSVIYIVTDVLIGQRDCQSQLLTGNATSVCSARDKKVHKYRVEPDMGAEKLLVFCRYHPP